MAENQKLPDSTQVARNLPEQPTHPSERRQTGRFSNDEMYNLSRAAIHVAKSEINPEFFDEKKDEMSMYLRVSADLVKKGIITEEQRNEYIAEFYAMKQVADSFDELTGAYSRASIKRFVNEVSISSPEDGKENIYIDLDINGLKKMNEESLRKHLSADAALKGFSHFYIAKLAEKFGYGARLGRLSGDELTIVVKNTTMEEMDKFFEDSEPERASAMREICETEGIADDITAMRAMTIISPGERFETIHERTDQMLIEQKAIRNAKRELTSIKATEEKKDTALAAD